VKYWLQLAFHWFLFVQCSHNFYAVSLFYKLMSTWQDESFVLCFDEADINFC